LKKIRETKLSINEDTMIKKEQQNKTIDILLKPIENLIEYIDNNNEATPIGTLEFMDRITKFNRVNVDCEIGPEEINSLAFSDDNYKLISLQDYVPKGGRVNKSKNITKRNNKRIYKRTTRRTR
jgi:hypothetical protein